MTCIARQVFQDLKGYKHYDYAVKHVEGLIAQLEDQYALQYTIVATEKGRFVPLVFCPPIYLHYFINKNCAVRVTN